MNSVSSVTEVYLIFLANRMKIYLQKKFTPMIKYPIFFDIIVHMVEYEER